MTRKKRPLWAMLIAGLAVPLLAGTVLCAQQNTRGANIHFRGPVAEIGRTAEGYISILTIKVNQSEIQVILNGWTQVIGPRGFAIPAGNLRLGSFLEVSGFFTRGGHILAQRIHLESGDAVDVEGTVESVLGSGIQVNGIPFQVDETSVIRRAGKVTSERFSTIDVGDIVRIRAGYVTGRFTIIELEIGARTVESDPLRLEGLVTFTNGNLMYLDVGIRNDRGGIVPAFVALNSSTQIIGTASPGTQVEVEGRFLPGQSLIQAIRITTDDNRDGNPYDTGPTEPTVAQVELKGIIADLQRGAGATGQLRINNTQISFDGTTEIEFEDGARVTSAVLQNGQEVEVVGQPLQGNLIRALKITIEGEDSPNSPDQGAVVELKGTVSGLIGQNDGTVTEFSISSTRILLDSETRVEENGTALPTSALKNGLSVEVKGWQQSDQSVLASIILIQVEPEDPGDSELIELKGTIQDLLRQADDTVTRIQVNDRLVVIQATTQIKGPSGEVSSSVLEIGQEVEVKGIERADLSILAKEIEIK